MPSIASSSQSPTPTRGIDPAIPSLVEELLRRADSAADDTDGAVLRSAAAALERETSARVAAEQRLQARERQMDLIEQLAGLGSWEIDLETDAIRWSREQRRIHGFERGAEPRTHAAFMAMVHPDDRHIVEDGMAALASREPLTVEFRIVRPDGDVRLLQARGQLVAGNDGRYTRVLGTSLDVTERRATELARRSSEESYRTIFRHASDAMWLHDVDTGAFIEVNEAACEVFGRTADETRAIGVGGLSAGVPPFTLDDAMRYIQKAAAGEPQRFEWLGPHKDGHDVWLEMRLRRVSIGGVDRILATGRDINDLKAAEAALRSANEALERRVAERTAELAASNAALAQEVAEHARAKEALLARTRELEAIFQALPDLYFHIDAETRMMDYRGGHGGSYVSPSFGRRIRETLPPEVCERMEEAIAIADAGALGTAEYQVEVNGERRDHEARFIALADGTHIGLVRDITERKNAERALREREEHFRRLIENASDHVMIVDETAAITYVAPSATRMLGYEIEEMMGTRPSDLVHPDDVPQVMRDFAWILEHPGEPFASTFRIRRKDGSYRTFENLGRTLSPNSASEGVVAFGRDITERKAAEEALERAKEEADRANRAKSEFLSRMSHELRTPMNSILGFAQLLARAELPPQQTKSVQHILKAGRHLLHLINEVLEIARIEAGRENFSLEPVALAPVVREALGLVRPLAQQHGVALGDGLCPDDAFVHADRQRLVQVLLNLFSNAIKYNRPGGEVNVTCRREGVAGAQWAIRVEDTGRGIASGRLDQLFTPFARLGAEQTDVEGTGLGLALSRRLCEAMGGGLALERSDERGSVFRIELERASDPLRVLEDTGTYPAIAAHHREATLLYVEDNLANLSLVETILLSRPGWRTIPALQGQIGVELAREHVPDVVLLDLHLPDIAGDEVLRRLRADARTASIPIIVVSADATSASLDRLRAAGADAYLTKPLDVDEFLRTLERFLPDGAVGARA